MNVESVTLAGDGIILVMAAGLSSHDHCSQIGFDYSLEDKPFECWMSAGHPSQDTLEAAKGGCILLAAISPEYKPCPVRPEQRPVAIRKN